MGPQVTAPDNGELKQLVVGLVTQIYYANRDGKDADDPEVTAALSALVQDLGVRNFTWSARLPRTAQEFRDVVTKCIEDAADQVSHRAYTALSHMIALFIEFALYAEQTSPDIDVPEFLHQAGLRAAS
jgi:hypothetical protein